MNHVKADDVQSNRLAAFSKLGCRPNLTNRGNMHCFLLIAKKQPLKICRKRALRISLNWLVEDHNIKAESLQLKCFINIKHFLAMFGTLTFRALSFRRCKMDDCGSQVCLYSGERSHVIGGSMLMAKVRKVFVNLMGILRTDFKNIFLFWSFATIRVEEMKRTTLKNMFQKSSREDQVKVTSPLPASVVVEAIP